MNERQKFILRAALLYVQANLDDVNEAYEYDADDSYGCIIVNGEIEKELEESEIETLLFELQ